MKINTLTSFNTIASNNTKNKTKTHNYNNQPALKLSNQNYMTDTVSFSAKAKKQKKLYDHLNITTVL